MLNRFKKIVIILLLLVLCTLVFSYNVNAAPANNTATDNTNEPTNNAIPINNTESNNEANTETTENPANNDVQAEIHTTETNAKIPNSTTLDDNPSIRSYSTVATLPEANLGLNNILNVILIALGILMVLLGIAILIKMKHN